MWMRLALWVLVVDVCNPTFAQESIFSDDFEDGHTCASWSLTLCPDPCDGVDNDCDFNIDEDAACDDGVACTVDYCGEASGCLTEISADACLIDGQCYPGGFTQPGNVCMFCDPNVMQSIWSENNGADCDDLDPCTTNDTCDSGACTGDPAVDQYEPDDSRLQSTYLGSVADDDDWSVPNTFWASLYPSADVDWYRYSEIDSSYVVDPNPRVELSAIPAGSDYKLCAYFECSDPGVTADNVECTSGSSASYDGLPGCCSNQFGSSSEQVTFTYRCDTDPAPLPDDESGTVYVRVSHVSGEVTCSSYMVQWGDN